MATPDASTNDRIVSAFCSAWEAGDVDAIVNAFADDAIYHNIPMEPVQGREAIAAVVSRFLGANHIVFDTLRQVSAGHLVMNERVDHLTPRGGNTISLPVMGAFELADGKITAWRDYFDAAALAARNE